MSTLERAIALAAKAHAGQVDKGGHPYILHPLRVMLGMSSLHEQMAAVLHDVVEDTSVTIADLRAEGFPEEVLEAIVALTKTPGEHRIAAAHRAAANPISRVVKLGDVADNMNLKRIPNPTDKDVSRLEEYAHVRLILLAGISAGESPTNTDTTADTKTDTKTDSKTDTDSETVGSGPMETSSLMAAISTPTAQASIANNTGK
jgi:GTP diphosphokinase / guanosine-3',5'-bis(diphosphate) 3'-diphosphatase